MILSFLAQFFVSTVIGFLFWKFFAGKYEGDKLERSLRPHIGTYRVHIHHWMWSSVILVIFILAKVYNPIFLGLLMGSIFQGLLYRDRFVFIYRDSDFEKIYSKYKKIM